MGAYDRVIYHGVVLNRRTVAMVQQMERFLGYELTIVQGSYSGAVSQSAGTHDGGGALDLAEYGYEEKVNVGRMVGFAIWHRVTIPHLWNGHCHGIAIGDRDLSDDARKQVMDYYAHLDGLASHAYDPTWRPTHIIPFTYPLPSLAFSTLRAQATKPTQALPAVRIFQRALNRQTGAGLTVDGTYGAATRAACKRWERQQGFTDADGIPNRRPTMRLGLPLFKLV